LAPPRPKPASYAQLPPGWATGSANYTLIEAFCRDLAGT
jgi:hypothetical protein